MDIFCWCWWDPRTPKEHSRGEIQAPVQAPGISPPIQGQLLHHSYYRRCIFLHRCHEQRRWELEVVVLHVAVIDGILWFGNIS